MQPQKDYAALVRDRFARKSRRTVTHNICIDPELYDQLEQAKSALQRTEDDDEGKSADRRAGALSARAAAEHQLEIIQEQVREVTVVGVFKVLPALEQAERHDKLRNLQIEHPDQINVNAMREAREDILLTFEHFTDLDGNPIEGMGRDELIMFLDIWSQAELIHLAREISDTSTDPWELPKFEPMSQNSQRSGATSGSLGASEPAAR